MKYDGGYGSSGNTSLKILLDILDSEDEKRFREELMKKDKEKYDDFLEYEKLLNRNFKK